EVAAVAVGIEGVERERALPGAGDAGENHQSFLRDLQRDALEIVLSGSLHEDDFGLHGDLVQEGTGTAQDKGRARLPQDTNLVAPGSDTSPAVRFPVGRASDGTARSYMRFPAGRTVRKTRSGAAGGMISGAGDVDSVGAPARRAGRKQQA